jgi:hypothetical protein
MASSPCRQGFGWHVSHLVRTELKALGFKSRGSSKVHYERLMPRGLVEYVVWVCHKWHDEFHIQWGVRHWCTGALFGNDWEFGCEEHICYLEYGEESELIECLGLSFEKWRGRRSRRLPEMEQFLRTNADAKRGLEEWHDWWKQFENARLRDRADFAGHFSSLPPEIVESAWDFMAHLRSAVKTEPEFERWQCFALLKAFDGKKKMTRKGDWWDYMKAAFGPRSFFGHLGDLDALLEPYDV